MRDGGRTPTLKFVPIRAEFVPSPSTGGRSSSQVRPPEDRVHPKSVRDGVRPRSIRRGDGVRLPRTDIVSIGMASSGKGDSPMPIWMIPVRASSPWGFLNCHQKNGRRHAAHVRESDEGGVGSGAASAPKQSSCRQRGPEHVRRDGNPKRSDPALVGGLVPAFGALGHFDCGGLRRRPDPHIAGYRAPAVRPRDRQRLHAAPSPPARHPDLCDVGPDIAGAPTGGGHRGGCPIFRHSGFDAREIAAAASDAVMRGRVRGASTITQQLAKNLFLSSARSPWRKIKEALLTRQMEQALTKRRILELYLNVAQFGPDVFGAQAAARVYFDRPAEDLGRAEAAALAASLSQPSYWHPGTLRGPNHRRDGQSRVGMNARCRGRGDASPRPHGRRIQRQGGEEGAAAFVEVALAMYGSSRSLRDTRSPHAGVTFRIGGTGVRV